jgi:hypothetical protein
MTRLDAKPFLLGGAAALVATLTALAASAHPAAFSIEQVMDAPYPSDMTAAPRGGAVAWVFDTKGVRNVWVADPGVGRKAQAITSFSQDGVDIGDIAWSQDGKWIASAKSFFSLPFSSWSCFSRLASDTSMPPNLLFQL